MTSFAPSACTGGSSYTYVSCPLKTSSMSPNSTVDIDAEDAKTEQGHPSTCRITCTLQLFNPIADAKEIVYVDKAREGHNEQDSSAPENATCVGGSITSSCVGKDANVTPSDESAFDDGKRANVSLLSLTLRAFGGCLLRPLRQGNKSVKAVAPPRKGLRLLPKRRGIRSRIQLFKSRSSSSDGSDPTTTTTLINGEQNRLLSNNGSGDSAEGFRTLPAPHNTNEIPVLEGSVSEVCDVSFYGNEDDKTLDDVSYAFSQAVGISEEEPRDDTYDDIGSIWDEGSSTDSEGRVMLQADTDADIVGTNGGDVISLMFDDEDETGGDLFALSDANEDGESDESNDDDNDGGGRFKNGSSEVSTMFRSIIPDELEYIKPLFTHKSLRQASEKQTSYEFVTNDEENDDGVFAAMEST